MSTYRRIWLPRRPIHPEGFEEGHRIAVKVVQCCGCPLQVLPLPWNRHRCLWDRYAFHACHHHSTLRANCNSVRWHVVLVLYVCCRYHASSSKIITHQFTPIFTLVTYIQHMHTHKNALTLIQTNVEVSNKAVCNDHEPPLPTPCADLAWVGGKLVKARSHILNAKFEECAEEAWVRSRFEIFLEDKTGEAVGTHILVVRNCESREATLGFSKVLIRSQSGSNTTPMQSQSGADLVRTQSSFGLNPVTIRS